MKKLLFCLCAMAMSLATFAQKGKSEVGINLDVAPTFSTSPVSANLGIGAKYRYGISNRFRLDANFTYYFNSLTELDNDYYDRVSMFDISVNAHYLIKLNDKMTFYPLAGLGFVKVSTNYKSNEEHEGGSSVPGGYDKDIFDKMEAEKNGPAKSNIVLNIGAGFEYAITDHLSAGVEIKYPIAVDVAPIPISLGVAYKF